MEPIFFPAPEDFRAWLEENHETADEDVMALDPRRLIEDIGHLDPARVAAARGVGDEPGTEADQEADQHLPLQAETLGLRFVDHAGPPLA